MKSMKKPWASPRRKSRFQIASRAPAARAAVKRVRRAFSPSVRKGNRGMTKSRAGTPAADSLAIASRRRSGRGARGSTRRSRAASIEARETEGDIDDQIALGGNGGEHVEISRDRGRLAGDADAKPW